MPAIIKPTEMQQEAIARLVSNLKALRNASGLSQNDMATTLGLTRVTYMNFENRRKEMSWNNYLAIMCFFTNCEKTKPLVMSLGLEDPLMPTDVKEL